MKWVRDFIAWWRLVNQAIKAVRAEAAKDVFVPKTLPAYLNEPDEDLLYFSCGGPPPKREL